MSFVLRLVNLFDVNFFFSTTPILCVLSYLYWYSCILMILNLLLDLLWNIIDIKLESAAYTLFDCGYRFSLFHFDPLGCTCGCGGLGALAR
jgi:hypothetical protein